MAAGGAAPQTKEQGYAQSQAAAYMNPNLQAQQQTANNDRAVQQDLALNRYNETNPYGSTSWNKQVDWAAYSKAMDEYNARWRAHGQNPNNIRAGTPFTEIAPDQNKYTTWSKSTSLSPELQKLFDIDVNRQLTNAPRVSELDGSVYDLAKQVAGLDASGKFQDVYNRMGSANQPLQDFYQNYNNQGRLDNYNSLYQNQQGVWNGMADYATRAGQATAGTATAGSASAGTASGFGATAGHATAGQAANPWSNWNPTAVRDSSTIKNYLADGQLDPTADYTTNYSDLQANPEVRQQVIDALYQRMNPQLSNNQNALESKLVNMGLRPGTEIWDKEMRRNDQAMNDAYLGAVTQGDAAMAQDLQTQALARSSNLFQARQNQDIGNELFGQRSGLANQRQANELALWNADYQRQGLLQQGDIARLTGEGNINVANAGYTTNANIANANNQTGASIATANNMTGASVANANNQTGASIANANNQTGASISNANNQTSTSVANMRADLESQMANLTGYTNYAQGMQGLLGNYVNTVQGQDAFNANLANTLANSNLTAGNSQLDALNSGVGAMNAQGSGLLALRNALLGG